MSIIISNLSCLNHHHQSLNREGRWGTTDDFATSFLHFYPVLHCSLDLPNSRPVHSLMLSSHLFLCPPCLLPNCCSEPVSYAAVEEDCTSALVIEVFDYSGKICTDVVLFHGCPQSGILNPVESLLEVYEDMVEVLPVLEVSLTEVS